MVVVGAILVSLYGCEEWTPSFDDRHD
jgi:hypothetical protein